MVSSFVRETMRFLGPSSFGNMESEQILLLLHWFGFVFNLSNWEQHVQ